MRTVNATAGRSTGRSRSRIAPRMTRNSRPSGVTALVHASCSRATQPAPATFGVLGATHGRSISFELVAGGNCGTTGTALRGFTDAPGRRESGRGGHAESGAADLWMVGFGVSSYLGASLVGQSISGLSPLRGCARGAAARRADPDGIARAARDPSLCGPAVLHALGTGLSRRRRVRSRRPNCRLERDGAANQRDRAGATLVPSVNATSWPFRQSWPARASCCASTPH